VDAIDTVFDATIPYDLRLYQSLDRMVQDEPWLLRDKAMIDQLKSIGIKKGKPFKPDSKTQEILEDAAHEAHDWIDLRYERVFSPPYYEGTQWAVPILQEVMKGLSTSFANPDSYPVEGRGLTYSYAFFSPKHPGGGQFYLMAIKDRQGGPRRLQHLSPERTGKCTGQTVVVGDGLRPGGCFRRTVSHNSQSTTS
jgi:hypothetical protein